MLFMDEKADKYQLRELGVGNTIYSIHEITTEWLVSVLQK